MEFMGYFEYDETTQHTIDYQHFLLDSPSAFHAADLVRQRLEVLLQGIHLRRETIQPAQHPAFARAKDLVNNRHE